jgi:hypothetical protein
MQVRPSGELAAAQGGAPVPVCGAKQRALLAILALQRGRPVSPDRPTDVLRDNGQATNPANALQAQIGQPRRTFWPTAVITTEAGYALAVDPDEVDVVRLSSWCPTGGGWPPPVRWCWRQPPWVRPSACGGVNRGPGDDTRFVPLGCTGKLATSYDEQPTLGVLSP